MSEHEAWKEGFSENSNGCKRLGTSTSSEETEYSEDIDRHTKDFIWSDDDQDGDAVELAFGKRKIEPGTRLDSWKKLIKYDEFANKELTLSSMADLQWSIPSMVDGFTKGQRKILFCSFKTNLVEELEVLRLKGYVMAYSAYNYDRKSIYPTVIGMAQNFVGSNNINLLYPAGQFGSRLTGGKDHATKYIYTRLMRITRFLFPKDDDQLLDYLKEDGRSIEPSWYIPIIPMILVNGSKGIGSRWSSYVPNYNPRDIIANIRRMLNDEETIPMDPWYRGFKGTVIKSESKETGVTYTITGIIEEVNSTTLRISELPICRWTEDYKQFLVSMMFGNGSIEEPFIKDYQAYYDDKYVNFEVILTEENMNVAKQEGLEKKFELTSTVSASNIHLFDSKGSIQKYDTPDQILEEFFQLRLKFYEKRKKKCLENLEFDLLKLDNRVRFTLGVVRGEIIIINCERRELVLELQEKGFTRIPKNSKGLDATVAGATVDGQEEDNDDNVDGLKGGVKASDYEYLLSTNMGMFSLYNVQQLSAEKERLQNEIAELRKATPKTLWLRDLDALEASLDDFEREDESEGK